MTVFCDNGDCFYIDEDGFCDCDKLSIVGGVCAGSYRSGRNACDGDVDERLKAENAKLREELEAVGIAAYLYGRDDIRAENAKLRDELDAAKHDLSLFSERIVELGAENAKLRELVRDMLDYGEGAGNGMTNFFADRIDAVLGDAGATGPRHGVAPDPDRVRELLYSCESREELCARVAALEAVVGRVG